MKVRDASSNLAASTNFLFSVPILDSPIDVPRYLFFLDIGSLVVHFLALGHTQLQLGDAVGVEVHLKRNKRQPSFLDARS